MWLGHSIDLYLLLFIKLFFFCTGIYWLSKLIFLRPPPPPWSTITNSLSVQMFYTNITLNLKRLHCDISIMSIITTASCQATSPFTKVWVLPVVMRGALTRGDLWGPQHNPLAWCATLSRNCDSSHGLQNSKSRGNNLPPDYTLQQL